MVDYNSQKAGLFLKSSVWKPPGSCLQKQGVKSHITVHNEERMNRLYGSPASPRQLGVLCGCHFGIWFSLWLVPCNGGNGAYSQLYCQEVARKQDRNASHSRRIFALVYRENYQERVSCNCTEGVCKNRKRQVCAFSRVSSQQNQWVIAI